jgi:hypothetical protein
MYMRQSFEKLFGYIKGVFDRKFLSVGNKFVKRSSWNEG